MHAISTRSFGTLLFVALLVASCSADRSPAGDTAQKSNPPSTPPPPSPAPPPHQISPVLPQGSNLLVQKGERVSALLGCFGCHGKDLHGKPWEDDPQFAMLYSSNLTHTVSRYSDAQLERAIREGVRYDDSPLWEMPSRAFQHLSAPDMQALIAYLRSLPQGGTDHPRMVLGPEGKKEVSEGTFTPATYDVKMTRHLAPAFAGEETAWGRYLSQTICGECHGPELRGHSSRPDLVVATAYSLSDFKTLLMTGQPTGNRKLGLMAKVAQSRFSRLTEPEVSAIHAYLVARAATPR